MKIESVEFLPRGAVIEHLKRPWKVARLTERDGREAVELTQGSKSRFVSPDRKVFLREGRWHFLDYVPRRDGRVGWVG